MFFLQIQTRRGWFSLARYDSLDDARPACDRAIKSEKVNSRLLEMPDSPEEHESMVVYERFYVRSEDPESRCDDDFDWLEPEVDYKLRWQEVGF